MKKTCLGDHAMVEIPFEFINVFLLINTHLVENPEGGLGLINFGFISGKTRLHLIISICRIQKKTVFNVNLVETLADVGNSIWFWSYDVLHL